MGFYWEKISQAMRPRVPFTALNTVWHHLDRDAKTILDVGCGKGGPMAFIRGRRQVYAVGMDIFEPYLRECQRRKSHDALVRCDVRQAPFRPKSFDVVLCMEVLEHLTEEEGLAMLHSLEGLSRRQVIITTPAGHHEQHGYDSNPWQEHKHIWKPEQLERLGYRVYGHGLRNLGGLSGVQSPLPRPLRPLVDLAWIAAGPFPRILPQLAGNMVAIKRMGR